MTIGQPHDRVVPNPHSQAVDFAARSVAAKQQLDVFYVCASVGLFFVLVPMSVGHAQTEATTQAVSSNALLSKTAPDEINFRHYEQYALTNAGDPASGGKVFTDQRTKCAVCHKVDGRGGDVGRDLSAIGGKFDRPHLIESLLDPSRQIVEGYRATNIVNTDGKVISGIIKQQNDQQVTIVDANADLHVILRQDIEDMSHSTVSIMPNGLTRELSAGEFTDLIAYLESLRGDAPEKMGAEISGPFNIVDGFQVQTVATGIDGATALEVLPDGRILICEQTGRVRVVENNKLLTTPFVTLPVDSEWERGVIGVTCDPEFPASPYVYVCWVAKEPYPHHRISRFTMRNNVAVPGSEKVLFRGDDQANTGGNVPAGHQGGALHFGADGKLYLGVGEHTAAQQAQKLDTILGKILRLNSDGSIPDDNPFFDKLDGKYRAIWAYGCRNPFTFAFRRSDGLMLINDVGGENEEINIGRAGANYGWPNVQHGDRPEYKTAEFDGPIHWYKESSLNGGDFCEPGSEWPEEWRGRYFFADFVQGWIHTLDPDNPRDVNTFVQGIRRPVDLRFAPNGSLYVLLRNAWVIDDKFEGGTGSLLRIAPNAVAGHTEPKSGATPARPKTCSNPKELPGLGPRPGEIYREYAVHNGGDSAWRVTDPNAEAEGAQEFLPNPVLAFNIASLDNAVRAEAVFDRWGGHLDTTDKRVRFNNHDWQTVPELTTAPKGHESTNYYSQDNPVIEVPLKHLRAGYNTLEGSIGPKNDNWWGQWGLYSMILRVYYDPDVVRTAKGKIVSPRCGDTLPENPEIRFEFDSSAKQIDVLAWYDGYDEDGNGIFHEWHGSRFQPTRGAAADLRDHVGTFDPTDTGGALTWTTHWVPDQPPESIKLIARVHDADGYISVTDIVDGLSLKRAGWSVRQYRTVDLPESFGVRVGQKKSCTISIPADVPLSYAENAVLHYRTWEGDDNHHEPFRLNGYTHKNQGNNHHYDYDVIPIPVVELKVGENTLTIHSRTEHHMLEVLWPGPAITVRYKTK